MSRRWQFGLIDLFYLTTGLAACSLVVAGGPGGVAWIIVTTIVAFNSELRTRGTARRRYGFLLLVAAWILGAGLMMLSRSRGG